MIKQFRPERWFFIFIALHLIGWTLVPALVRLNLPLDSIEGTIWGHQLEWGYDKNPFLNGWLTALATHLSGPSGWTMYLFSQLSVVACFFAVWLLAKRMVPPAYALISVLVLEGIQYYNFHAIDFNDNTLELSTWAFAIFFFYKALREPSKLAWILTGLFAGLGMMAKYYTAALLAGMALFLLTQPSARKQLKTAAPYFGLATFLIVILPHVVWLFFHQFITVTYVFERASSPPTWTNHFFFPAQFIWQQIEAFLPAAILFGLLWLGKKPDPSNEKITVSSFDKAFLFYVGLGPFLLTALLSLVLGIKLRAGWGMPLQSLWGIILVAAFPPFLTRKKLGRFIATIFILMGVLLSGYRYSLINSHDFSSANFPGQEVAYTITKLWHERYHTELRYVAGSRWIGGNIGFYSPDHPAVFIECDEAKAPWINLSALEKQGGIFVWDMTDKETLPNDIQKRFPKLLPSEVLTFNLLRNNYHLQPIKIGIAILPPSNAN